MIPCRLPADVCHCGFGSSAAMAEGKSLKHARTSDVGGRVGLVRHGWHVCGGCLSCEVSVFWL